jgi:hypothetical protein
VTELADLRCIFVNDSVVFLGRADGPAGRFPQSFFECVGVEDCFVVVLVMVVEDELEISIIGLPGEVAIALPFGFLGSLVDGLHACGLIFVFLCVPIAPVDSSEFGSELRQYSLVVDPHAFVVIADSFQEGIHRVHRQLLFE